MARPWLLLAQRLIAKFFGNGHMMILFGLATPAHQVGGLLGT
jgi:hypothetical protein